MRVSCGDSAPPSIKSSTSRSCTRPRTPRCSFDQRLDGDCLQPAGVRQCVESDDARVTSPTPPEIESGAFQRGRADAAKPGDFVCAAVRPGGSRSHRPSCRSVDTTRQAIARRSISNRAKRPRTGPSRRLGDPTRATPRPPRSAASTSTPFGTVDVSVDPVVSTRRRLCALKAPLAMASVPEERPRPRCTHAVTVPPRQRHIGSAAVALIHRLEWPLIERFCPRICVITGHSARRISCENTS